MSYATWLSILTWFSGDKIAQILKIIAEIEAMFAPPVIPGTTPPAGNLQTYTATPQETYLEGVIAQRLTEHAAATGLSQAAFDGTKLRNLWALVVKWGPTIITLLKLFGVNVPPIPLPGFPGGTPAPSGGLT